MSVLDEHWYAHPDDLIGGWCVLNRDHPPSRLNRNADPDARKVGNLLGEDIARHIVELHNAGLPGEAVSTSWPDQPEVSADIAVAALEASAQLRGECAGPSVRSGYQCTVGGDACPGHRSKWLLCDLEPHHAAGEQRTAEEQTVLEPTFVEVNLPGGGTWTGPAAALEHYGVDALDRLNGGSPFDNGGTLPSGLAWYRNDTGEPVALDRFPEGLTRIEGPSGVTS